MRKIIINGGASLQGEVKIGGSKNSVVALIPAAILCKDKVRIYNYPNISDVEVLIDILKDLNVSTIVEKDYLEIDSSNIINTSLVSEKMSLLRASYYFMGALLALFNHAEINLPGGCYLGPRPIDLHVKGIKQLNCEIDLDEGMIKLHSNKLIGDKIFLDIASVGATINIILASVFINGQTIIENAAKEPEIVNVANFLNNMGASIEGAGTGIIKITGVKSLHGTNHEVIPDRIEAGTYILFGAAAGKDLIVNHVEPLHLNALIAKLNKCNVETIVDNNKIIVSKSKKLLPLNIRTAVYPGFPTDLQQIMTALMTQANGVSIINETIYSSRFKNCDDLIKLGANIQIENSSAIIFGSSKLKGTEVTASDLRGGASLILAGLVAENKTVIDNVEHIFRGYGNIVENLKNLNVDIKLEEY
ncbi:MAG: UDP-N-acetylglucosamine 1-carboxyvinyltransferase [Haloplasmataceae bacterium]|jgi:UDP-N-acetylglucosamine 1-carboxyvinyltransferase|nr:UDP-N-acetylglucosamine 1-carboxyvinyltransferase [Haloplasmataceae bacterium]